MDGQRTHGLKLFVLLFVESPAHAARLLPRHKSWESTFVRRFLQSTIYIFLKCYLIRGGNEVVARGGVSGVGGEWVRGDKYEDVTFIDLQETVALCEQSRGAASHVTWHDMSTCDKI